VAQIHAINTIKQCQRLKAIKNIKLTVAWSLGYLKAKDQNQLPRTTTLNLSALTIYLTWAPWTCGFK